MKLYTAAAALLLAAPLAMAQATTPPPQNDTIGKKADRAFDRAEDTTSRTVNPPPGEPSLGKKAGNVFDRMEAGTKRMWDNVTGKKDTTAPARVDNGPSDSHAMGAPAADPTVPRRADTSR
jgi:hypothetical protein